jgi:hypothetical protein
MLARRGTPSYPFTAPWPANRQRISLVLVKPRVYKGALAAGPRSRTLPDRWHSKRLQCPTQQGSKQR